MNINTFEHLFPASTGSIASVIAFSVVDTIFQAAIFAVVGGILGWGVARLLNKLFPVGWSISRLLNKIFPKRSKN